MSGLIYSERTLFYSRYTHNFMRDTAISFLNGSINVAAGGGLLEFDLGALASDFPEYGREKDARQRPLIFFCGAIPFIKGDIPALSQQFLEGGDFTKKDLEIILIGGHFACPEDHPVSVLGPYKGRFSPGHIRERFRNPGIASGIKLVQKEWETYRFYIQENGENALVAILINIQKGWPLYNPSLPEPCLKERLDVLAEFVRDYKRVIEQSAKVDMGQWQ